MKRFLSLIFIVTIIFSLTACTKVERTHRISVVATIFPYYDFAKNVAGDYADVEMLLPAGSDVHSFEPTAEDIKKIQNCDLFIYNGGESDAWVDTILESIDKGNGPVCMKMMTYIKGLKEQDENHNFGDEYDEHIWTSPRNASNLLGMVESNLQRLDPANTSHYEENCKKYAAEIYSISQTIEQNIKSAKKSRIIVGDRFPLIYFVNQYDLRWDCAFPGCSTETEPSLARMSELENKLKMGQYRAVIKLANSGNNVADTLAEDTGVKVVTFYDCENVTQEEIDHGATYATLMVKNAYAIKEALS